MFCFNLPRHVLAGKNCLCPGRESNLVVYRTPFDGQRGLLYNHWVVGAKNMRAVFEGLRNLSKHMSWRYAFAIISHLTRLTIIKESRQIVTSVILLYNIRLSVVRSRWAHWVNGITTDLMTTLLRCLNQVYEEWLVCFSYSGRVEFRAE